MNAILNAELHLLLRDLRTHWFKAGLVYVREGKVAALEVISIPTDKNDCHLTVIVTPYAPSGDENPEALAGASEAVEVARQSPLPRVRAAAEFAAANLACPPAGNLTAVQVDFWVEDPAGEWSERGQQPLDANGQTRFDGVPAGLNCWIELLPTITALGKPPPPPPLAQSAPAMRENGPTVSAGSVSLTYDSLYRDFLAEREEILKVQRLESERVGYDIGLGKALAIWLEKKHRAQWCRGRQTRPLASDPGPKPHRPEPAAAGTESATSQMALGRLKPLRSFMFENSSVAADVAVCERKLLWLVVHTADPTFAGAIVRFQLGPARGSVQLHPAGEGWQGVCRLKLPVDRLDRFKPEFSTEPLRP